MIIELCLRDFTYIFFFSKTSSLYYTGYSSDVEKRLIEHNETSHNTFTSKHRPWILKGSFEVKGNESDAITIEKFIKKQKSKVFIEKILNHDTILNGALDKLVRVPKLRD